MPTLPCRSRACGAAWSPRAEPPTGGGGAALLHYSHVVSFSCRLPFPLLAAGLAVIASMPLMAGAVSAQEPVFELTESESPRAAVEIDTAARAEALEDAAWTFRFLVPTALVLSALIVVGVIGRYGIGVRGRYRVRE